MIRFFAAAAMAAMCWVGGANAATFAQLTVSNGQYDSSANQFTADFAYSVNPTDNDAVRNYSIDYSFDIGAFGIGAGSGSVGLGANSINGLLADANALFAPFAAGFPNGSGGFAVPADIVLAATGFDVEAAIAFDYALSFTSGPSATAGVGSIVISNATLGVDGGSPQAVNAFLTQDFAFAGSAALTAPVPLPATLPLLAGGLGLIGLAARRRRAAA